MAKKTFRVSIFDPKGNHAQDLVLKTEKDVKAISDLVPGSIIKEEGEDEENILVSIHRTDGLLQTSGQVVEQTFTDQNGVTSSVSIHDQENE